MAEPRNNHSLRVRLFDTIDGQQIEEFVVRRRLRSGGDEVQAPDGMGRFEPGKRYGTVVITSSSTLFARATANEIATKFDGIVY